MIDSSVPHPRRAGLDKARYRLAELRTFSWRDRGLWLRAQLARTRGQPEKNVPGLPLIDETDMRELERQSLKWEVPRFAGQVVVFRAALHVRGYRNRPGNLGWAEVLDDWREITLPGDHTQMLVEPHCQKIAAELMRLLAEAGKVRAYAAR